MGEMEGGDWARSISVSVSMCAIAPRYRRVLATGGEGSGLVPIYGERLIAGRSWMRGIWENQSRRSDGGARVYSGVGRGIKGLEEG